MKIKDLALRTASLLAGCSLFFSFFCSAALYTRDLDGNLVNGHEAVYDDVLDITWLADANIAGSNNFGVAGVNADGTMSWDTAAAFFAAMNADNGGLGYLGVNTWRRPTTSPVGGGGVFDTAFTYDGSTDRGYQLTAPVGPNNPNGQSAGFTGAEMPYHYYNNFGGVGLCSGVGTTCHDEVDGSVYGVDDAANSANAALFSNIILQPYWTGTEENALRAFRFNFNFGGQGTRNKASEYYVWAVASGDVAASAVPVPAAVWFFSSALLCFSGARRIHHR